MTNKMNNKKKIEVVKDYISQHKNADVEDWFLQCIPGTYEQQYLEIYSKLENDVFGEVTVDDWGDNRIEISSHDSKTGNPIIFEWEANQEADGNR